MFENISVRSGSSKAAAQFSLGLFYLNNRKIKNWDNCAVFWFKAPALRDMPCAQKALGVCYYNGWGVKQNRKKAVKLLNKAAEGGDEEAKKLLVKITPSKKGDK